MKNIFLLLLTSIFVISCNSTTDKANKENALGDTIQTPSGLKYYYLKQGEGRKIAARSKVQVYTDLYLNNDDTVFWTTSTAPDSMFSFYHKRTSLINGFSELHDYLVEGDEIIAILPDSIAYGKEGRNGVPPAATLVYNPLVIKSVSEPKELLSDSLYAIIKSDGVQMASAAYDRIISSDEKEAFHQDDDLLVNDLLRNLSRDSLFIETEAFANFLLSRLEDNMHHRTLAFYAASAAEQQGNFEMAISYLDPWVVKEPEQPWWQNKINELKSKIKEE